MTAKTAKAKTKGKTAKAKAKIANPQVTTKTKTTEAPRWVPLSDHIVKGRAYTRCRCSGCGDVRSVRTDNLNAERSTRCRACSHQISGPKTGENQARYRAWVKVKDDNDGSWPTFAKFAEWYAEAFVAGTRLHKLDDEKPHGAKNSVFLTGVGLACIEIARNEKLPLKKVMEWAKDKRRQTVYLRRANSRGE